MNKIEKAISDCKLRIESLNQERILLRSNFDLLTYQLETLEIIEKDKSIPHENPIEGVKTENK